MFNVSVEMVTVFFDVPAVPAGPDLAGPDLAFGQSGPAIYVYTYMYIHIWNFTFFVRDLMFLQTKMDPKSLE